jgi:cellobiose phosphorylase
MEFNKLLRGNKNTTFNIISSDVTVLQHMKYVITLDADTQLPRDCAKKLIGSMSHVLNKAQINLSQKKVIRGYGVMQPRVNVGIEAANKTSFSKIFSGETGTDIYTTAISDIYQDLFDEGIFTGKGIYDIDVFNTVLENEIPQNSILSHDLLEGCYARTALLTDLELIDGYPAYYISSSKRLHRWVRGDWQLIKWLRNQKLNSLSKWKMMDNLRRSLLMPSVVGLIVLGLTVLPNKSLWLIYSILSIAFPMIFDATEVVIAPIKGISLSGKLKDTKIIIKQVFLIFCFIPFQAINMIDAIIRSLYRVFISKKKLLEWQTAAYTESTSGKNLYDYIDYMWKGSIISIIILILAFLKSIYLGIIFAIPCLIWIVSPYVAYTISKEIEVSKIKLTNDDKALLRVLSRRTWAYFEDFTNEINNWLVPDNFQEEPSNGVATRTSPTNIGMGLITNLCAYDLGYIGIKETIDRLNKTLTSVEDLDKFNGHLYNWYDTLTKAPLFPRYVSTVDSGNLVAYMWICSEGINEYLNKPLVRKECIQGIKDIVLLAEEELVNLNIKYSYKEFIDKVDECNLDIEKWENILFSLRSLAIKIKNIAKSEELYWTLKVESVSNNFIDELKTFTPWIVLINNYKEAFDFIRNELVSIFTFDTMKDLSKRIDNIILKIEERKLIEDKYTDLRDEMIMLLKTSKDTIISEFKNVEEISTRLNRFVENTDFTVLFNKERKLFSIGYDIENETMNNSYYDLLASEARCASFMAIAKGDVEQKHWFTLGRGMTMMGLNKGLVSWSGTMFEYFMPLLIMKSYPETLLEETYKGVIEFQKRYCKNKNIPWGISESAYYYFDTNLNYQYKAFGVPRIGLKRGLENDLVIAPYATLITLQKNLKDGIKNINDLIKQNFMGKYGFYEAIDYTKDRITKGKKYEKIKCFMVHHQGMSLMALNNVLNNNILQERFHSIPRVKATELILQEKMPKAVIYDIKDEFDEYEVNRERWQSVARVYNTSKTSIPEIQLLSNRNYSLMISNSGSGYSKLGKMMLYRWKEDVTCDDNGIFFYIKNVNTKKYWSPTYEPCKTEGNDYNVSFFMSKAEFKKKEENILSTMEIVACNDEDGEIRKLTLTNHNDQDVILEITSYCEVTLTTYDSDIVHPTFSNLFIETEYVDKLECLIAARRPRKKEEKKNYIMQTIVVDGENKYAIEYETNRLNFIGRGRSTANPTVIENDIKLNNNVGAVLDPILSMRQKIELKHGETKSLYLITAVSNDREELIEVAKKYKHVSNIGKIFEIIYTKNNLELKYLGLKSNAVNLYQMVASRMLFLNNTIRDRERFISNISKYQKDLWPYGISGDLPILLAVVEKEQDTNLLKQVLKAHQYLSRSGVKVDLIIMNDEEITYDQPLQKSIDSILGNKNLSEAVNKNGGIFIINKSLVKNDFVELIYAISKLVINCSDGSIINQIKNDEDKKVTYKVTEHANFNDEAKDLMTYIRNKSYGRKNEYDRYKKGLFKYNSVNDSIFKYEFAADFSLDSEELNYNKEIEQLLYFNGIGGFRKDTHEYEILLDDYNNTPAPWINVICNNNFGFHVSESGTAYTWQGNSRENKITPWNNDPVSDMPSEAFYIKDNDRNEIWSITPKPIRDNGKYLIKHGFGFSTFVHTANYIKGTETMFVPLNENCKIIMINLKNISNKKRNLSCTYYAQLVLGVVPHKNAQYITTYIDQKQKYIYAYNRYNENFGDLKAFLYMSGGVKQSFTGDRKEFLGRGGSIEYPIALGRQELSNNCGSGLDPCLTEIINVELKPLEEKNIVVILGECSNTKEIETIIKKYGNTENSNNELINVHSYWQKTLGIINVKTPNESMNLLLNGWLMYQTIACRYLSRTAFYQSGGAYGYRDQLQDSMAIGFVNSNVTREQIIRSAERQFIEGDVQHWWHPVVDSGIRTRFSDDLLWLPYVTIDYIRNTGDYSILDVTTNYLEDEPLREGEDERYTIARKSNVEGTIYEHCIKAIDKSLKFGEHNIPLIGSGDWNDGMSTVGNKGKGESVWLGWFLYSILNDFIELCIYKADNEKISDYKQNINFIKENLEKYAWDGKWYRRAYFDNGTPLGSEQNDECKIDSLAQTWSIISGGGDDERKKEAMDSLEKYLVKEEEKIVLLLTPAFDNSTLEPGYIKGYVPGVRENGAQYTHAAIWAIIAMAKLGDGDKAGKLFNIINPINHSTNKKESEIYKVEPYVIAADVYNKEPYVGRGGWTWYTGAAGWMFRAGVESILGLKMKGNVGFTIEPVIPSEWNEFEMTFKHDDSEYSIKVKREGAYSIKLDDAILQDKVIPYIKGNHKVEVSVI